MFSGLEGFKQYGDILINTTPAGNFFKCRLLSDSDYILSFGRERVEQLIDTYACNGSSIMVPDLLYENYSIMILYTKAGSNSWQNTFFTFPDGKIHKSQSLYIDTTHLRYIDLDTKQNDVSFIVHDIRMGISDTLKSRYSKFRKYGDPYLHISDVSIDEKQLYYTVYCDNNITVRDTLPI